MKIQTSDPDIATVYRRIKDGFIDLQPDFQRDLVWNLLKKQTFIDTILRGWHFPPIVLVTPPSDDRMDVLDGQQRLNAIFEFIEGGFSINGNIEPRQSNLTELNGLYYKEIPLEVKSKFNRYSLRVSELYDYNEDEPYELFFRLNQGSVLTPAEKRNTLYGSTREHVRQLVIKMQDLGLNIDRIGFNNNRLAYEDVIARLLYALTVENISKKITDQLLIEMYRFGNISSEIYQQGELSIIKLSKIIGSKVKLSKPTLFTWLLILAHEDISSDFFYKFERMRKDRQINNNITILLIDIFQERSATSVNDVMAVQLRLLSIFMIGIISGEVFNSYLGKKAIQITKYFLTGTTHTEDTLIELMHSENWGSL